MFLTRSAMFSSPLGQRLEFYSMSGRETLGRLFSYEVDLLSTDDGIDLSELLGQGASVVLERTDGTLREFTGYVTQFALVGEHGNFARYRATLKPWLWFLGQNRDSRIFQALSVPEIAKEIFRERGFTDVEDALSGQYQAWEYLVQYRESDLNFISRMFEQEGIYYFFKHDSGKHVLVLADGGSAHEAPPGYEHVPYFPPAERERRQEEHVDSWVLSRQIRQGLVTLRDFNFTYPAPFEGEKSAPLPEPGGSFELFDYPAEVNQESDDKAKTATSALAEIRLEEHQVDYETVRGAGPIRGLMAGSLFSLTQFPRDDQNKQHLVVSCSYELRVAEYESNIVEDKAPLFRFQFSAIDAKRPYRAPRTTPKPVVDGPQTAIVVGNPDQEIWTDEFGRIKLQFHWDRRGQSDEDSSCWVRVSQAWAGQGWGSMHLPRIGQEVIVDFLEGDPDRPIVTGRVHNKDNPVPYKLPDNQTQSGFKSHSTKGGGADNFNEIRFEDKKGAEELHIQAEKDMSTLVKNNQSTTVKASRSAGVTGSDSVSVGGDRSVSVTGKLTRTVKGGLSSEDVTGKYTLTASDTIDVTATNSITLKVGGTTIVLTQGDITLHTCGTTMKLDFAIDGLSEGGGHLRLDGNAFAEGKEGASLFLSSFGVLHSAKGSELALDADSKLSAAGALGLAGKTVTAVGDSEVGISGGGGGKVTLNAGSAELGGPQTTVSSDGVTSVSGSMVKIG